jgi:hypothetical protein
VPRRACRFERARTRAKKNGRRRSASASTAIATPDFHLGFTVLDFYRSHAPTQETEFPMDLYLPDDFVPHADYSWSQPTADARGPVCEAVPDEGWFGAEAFVAPRLCDALREAAEWQAL